MRKVIVNISDSTYEKLRLEAILQEKSIVHIIQERIMHRPFGEFIENQFSKWVDEQVNQIIEE